MSKQTQNKKAGLYYRLSQEDERAGESLSIENQKKILEKYARENGFEIIDEYIDDGWSGPISTAPAYRDCWRMPRTAGSMQSSSKTSAASAETILKSGNTRIIFSRPTISGSLPSATMWIRLLPKTRGWT